MRPGGGKVVWEQVGNSINTEEASRHYMVQVFPGQAKGLSLSPLGDKSHGRKGPSDTWSSSGLLSSQPGPRAQTLQVRLPVPASAGL